MMTEGRVAASVFRHPASFDTPYSFCIGQHILPLTISQPRYSLANHGSGRCSPHKNGKVHSNENLTNEKL